MDKFELARKYYRKEERQAEREAFAMGFDSRAHEVSHYDKGELRDAFELGQICAASMRGNLREAVDDFIAAEIREALRSRAADTAWDEYKRMQSNEP